MSLVMRRVPVLPTHDGTWLPGGRPALRWWLTGVALVLMASALLFLSRMAADASRFPVLQVDVVGTLDFADRGALRERVRAHLDRSFYTLDIDAISDSLEAMPWVSEARVTRLWPDRLMIEIDEREPIARWNDTGLVATDGAVFEAPQLRADHPRHLGWMRQLGDLPWLEGAVDRHAVLLGEWRTYARRLDALGLSLRRLGEDARRSLTLYLDDGGIVRLGRDRREARFAAFLEVYPRVAQRLGDAPARFDMRYPNGFALAAADGDAGWPR